MEKSGRASQNADIESEALKSDGIFCKVFLLMVMLDLISENRLMGWITFLNVIQKKKKKCKIVKYSVIALLGDFWVHSPLEKKIGI